MPKLDLLVQLLNASCWCLPFPAGKIKKVFKMLSIIPETCPWIRRAPYVIVKPVHRLPPCINHWTSAMHHHRIKKKEKQSIFGPSLLSCMFAKELIAVKAFFASRFFPPTASHIVARDRANQHQAKKSVLIILLDLTRDDCSKVINYYGFCWFA
jgi:hypothetical protein